MKEKNKSVKKTKKNEKTRKLSVYSNLSRPSNHSKRKSNKIDVFKKDTQYLKSLPKWSPKRLTVHFNPKRIKAYWFSRKGAIRALKILGVIAIVSCLFVGGLFAYFRKDLDAIRPSELAKSVQSNVNTYLDRNGLLLWDDKGTGDYKLVVESNNINKFLKQATVSIEDKDFYKHSGISLTGLARATMNNLLGGKVQGGSTLTQQLVKQVFFENESGDRTLTGIPRKIKEMILAIEVERMYNKDQIITLYLNESPYGGRRNGAESGAQTYFAKTAKELTLPEAALLAAIPQNPSVYDPYNIEGHESLLKRQHAVLDNMASMKYITKAQAAEAKKYPIIDHISPESNQYTDIKAPHFVQMVRSQLEDSLGKGVLGKGGLTITTTLDLRIQNKLEEAMTEEFASNDPIYYGFTNGASTVVDVKTSQIVALMGSRDFNYEGFGQDNAATSFIQPGSNIKPLIYAKLFENKGPGQLNFGSGSILKDENIDSLYGAEIGNDDHAFLGDVVIRKSLATSRNIPAVKAMYVSGVKNTIETIHKMGGLSYCTNGNDTTVGLSAAIGGCGIKQIDLVNAYATIARQGIYKPQTTVLEVKNKNNKEVLHKWVDVPGTVAIDKQSAYITSDILTDANARAGFASPYSKGFVIPGVKTGTKTGTSDKGGKAKDLWMSSYSPVLAMTGWLGNPDTSILRVGNSHLIGKMIEKVMSYAHKEIYKPAGLWTENEWFNQPSGIQRIGNEVYPSWWDKSAGKTNVKMNFDTVSKKKATSFTPVDSIIELDVVKSVDPVTKKEIFIAPDGYDASKDDDIHLTDSLPSVSISQTTAGPVVSGEIIKKYTYTISVTPTIVNGNLGKAKITNIKFTDGPTVKNISAAPYENSYTISAINIKDKVITVTATVEDGTNSVTSEPITVTLPAWSTVAEQ